MSASQSLAERVRQGDQDALEQLWAIDEDRLRRMAELRLDRRLEGRVDVDQLLRDAFAEATKRCGECPHGPKSHPVLWLRELVAERLAAVHRQKLNSLLDEVSMDVSLYREA